MPPGVLLFLYLIQIQLVNEEALLWQCVFVRTQKQGNELKRLRGCLGTAAGVSLREDTFITFFAYFGSGIGWQFTKVATLKVWRHWRALFFSCQQSNYWIKWVYEEALGVIDLDTLADTGINLQNYPWAYRYSSDLFASIFIRRGVIVCWRRWKTTFISFLQYICTCHVPVLWAHFVSRRRACMNFWTLSFLILCARHREKATCANGDLLVFTCTHGHQMKNVQYENWHTICAIKVKKLKTKNKIGSYAVSGKLTVCH